jgi:hypothetical protein
MNGARIGKEKTLSALVKAQFGDYERRKRILTLASPERRVRMELVYLNSKLYEATAETVGSSLADTFIREIGEGIGYTSSGLFDCMSEACYKRYKAEVMAMAARRLYLL